MKLFTLIAIILLVPVFAQAQVNTIEANIMDQKVNEPGFVLVDDTAFQGLLYASWLDVCYLHKLGDYEPAEVDIEGSWDLYQRGPWTVNLYAGIFLLNLPAPESDNPEIPSSTVGEFRSAHEVGLTGSYDLPSHGPRVGLYAARFTSDVTHGLDGILLKFFVQDQRLENDQVAVGDFNWGWKALLCYNDQYFFDGSGFSHLQGRAWVNYQATDRLSVGCYAGKQISLMDDFDDPSWVGLSSTYNF